MRKPRSFFEAALFGILTGINPFSRTGHPVLDALYLASVAAAVGLFLAQLAAGCTPAYAGCAFPTPSTFSTPSTLEPDMDVIDTDFLWALAGAAFRESRNEWGMGQVWGVSDGAKHRTSKLRSRWRL